MTRALIASLLLLFVPWTFDPFIRPKMLAVAIIVFFWARGWKKYHITYSTPADEWAWPFITFYLIALALSLDKPKSLLGEPSMPIQGLLQIFLYWQCFRIGMEHRNRYEIKITALACALPMCAYAFMQKMGVDFNHVYSMPIGRAISTQGSPVYLTSMIILLFPLSFAVPWATPFLLIGAWSVVSRSAWLGIGVGLACFWGRRRPWLAAGAAIMGLFGVWAIHSRSGASVSDLERLKTYKIALEAWNAHPWFGWGPDNFKEAFRMVRKADFNVLLNSNHIVQGEAHNLILQSLATIGVFGTVAFICLLASVLLAIEDEAVRAGLVALLVQGMIEPIPFAAMALASVLAGATIRLDGLKKQIDHLPVLAGTAMATCLCLFAADCFYQYGQFRETVESQSKIYSLTMLFDPGNLERATDYNVTLFRMNQGGDRWSGIHANAIAWFESKIHPYDALAHQVYADAAFLVGDNKTAKAEIEAASVADPVYVPIQVRKQQFSGLR